MYLVATCSNPINRVWAITWLMPATWYRRPRADKASPAQCASTRCNKRVTPASLLCNSTLSSRPTPPRCVFGSATAFRSLAGAGRLPPCPARPDRRLCDAPNPMTNGLNQRDFSLDPEDNARLANLCGPFDEHLRQVELRLGVEIDHRGNLFQVIGEEGAARASEKVLQGTLCRHRKRIAHRREDQSAPGRIGHRCHHRRSGRRRAGSQRSR